MLRILIISMAALIFIYSCSTKKTSTAGIESNLLRLNNLYDSALLHHDTAALKKLYSDDFVYTNPEGKLLTREEQLISVAISEMKWDSGRSEGVRVKIYDDMAVMTGALRASGNYRGNPVSIHERYTAVWIRKDTSWQMVAEQGSIVR